MENIVGKAIYLNNEASDIFTDFVKSQKAILQQYPLFRQQEKTKTLNVLLPPLLILCHPEV
jgi:hypothetical protein